MTLVAQSSVSHLNAPLIQVLSKDNGTNATIGSHPITPAYTDSTAFTVQGYHAMKSKVPLLSFIQDVSVLCIVTTLKAP